VKQVFQIFSSCSYNTTKSYGYTSEKEIKSKVILFYVLILTILIPTILVKPDYSQLQVSNNEIQIYMVGDKIEINGKTAPESDISLIIENSAGYTLWNETTSSEAGAYNITIQIPENAMLGRYASKININGILFRQRQIIITRMSLDEIYQKLLQNTETLEQGIRIYFKQRRAAIPPPLLNEFQSSVETKNQAKELWEENNKILAINKSNQALMSLKNILQKSQNLDKLPIKTPPPAIVRGQELQRILENVKSVNKTLLNLEKRGIVLTQAKRNLNEMKALLNEAETLRAQGEYQASDEKISETKKQYQETVTIIKSVSNSVQVQLKEEFTERLLKQTYILEDIIHEIRASLTPREKLQARRALIALSNTEQKIQNLQTRIESGEDIPSSELTYAQRKIDEAIEEFESSKIKEQLKNQETSVSPILTDQKTDSKDSTKEDTPTVENNEKSLKTSKNEQAEQPMTQPLT
jgi:hypothetical protein